MTAPVPHRRVWAATQPDVCSVGTVLSTTRPAFQGNSWCKLAAKHLHGAWKQFTENLEAYSRKKPMVPQRPNRLIVRVDIL